jgi:hypothetical protein
MIEYRINEIKEDMVFLTREEKVPVGNLTMTLSKSIIFEKRELNDIMKVITDYANQTGNQRVQ